MNKETKELIKEILKLFFRIIELIIMLIGFYGLNKYLFFGGWQ